MCWTARPQPGRMQGRLYILLKPRSTFNSRGRSSGPVRSLPYRHFERHRVLEPQYPNLAANVHGCLGIREKVEAQGFRVGEMGSRLCSSHHHATLNTRLLATFQKLIKGPRQSRSTRPQTQYLQNNMLSYRARPLALQIDRLSTYPKAASKR